MPPNQIVTESRQNRPVFGFGCTSCDAFACLNDAAACFSASVHFFDTWINDEYKLMFLLNEWLNFRWNGLKTNFSAPFRFD